MTLSGKGPLWTALVLVLSVCGEAQELRGRSTGTVKDTSGAAGPGATVTAPRAAPLQPPPTTTRDVGTYQFPALPSGTYTLAFESGGFQTLRREGIRVLLSTTLAVDAQLEMAGRTETMVITGESPVV